MGMATVESAFVVITTKGICGYNHPDFPALRVTLEVLDATESYLWVRMLDCHQTHWV
jgi:hypothetical protein